MISDLTISRAVWACKVDGGVPLVAGIVDEVLVGVPHAKIIDGTATPADAFGPPTDLAALRDARCESCIDEYGERLMQNCDNPRCVDGRLLVDVRVGCELCALDPVDADSWSICAEHADGWRTVKGLIDVVPVMDGEFNHDWNIPQLVVDRSGVALFGPLLTNGTDLTPAHVEALGTIQPGQWAWLLTEVEA